MDVAQHLELPNDIWRVIFSLISCLETLVVLQRVCNFFRSEIKLKEMRRLFEETNMTPGKILILVFIGSDICS